MDVPLYFLGVNALSAEKTALEKRENDEFTSNRIIEINQQLKVLENNRQVELLNSRANEQLFLEDVSDIYSELSFLDGITINWKEVKLAKIDQLAIEPQSAVKPKKAILLLAGALIGLILGVFIALLRVTLRSKNSSKTTV